MHSALLSAPPGCLIQQNTEHIMTYYQKPWKTNQFFLLQIIALSSDLLWSMFHKSEKKYCHQMEANNNYYLFTKSCQVSEDKLVWIWLEGFDTGWWKINKYLLVCYTYNLQTKKVRLLFLVLIYILILHLHWIFQQRYKYSFKEPVYQISLGHTYLKRFRHRIRTFGPKLDVLLNQWPDIGTSMWGRTQFVKTYFLFNNDKKMELRRESEFFIFQKKIQVENESTNTEMVLLAGCSGGNNDKGEIISEMGRDWEEVDCKSARA